MRKSVVLALLGIACVALGLRVPPLASWIVVWVGMDMLLVAAAYAVHSAALFGKKPSGALSMWRGLLLLPYLMVMWASWRLHAMATAEPPYHQIDDGLWLGRRIPGRALPGEVRLVVDLTEAFPRPRDHPEQVGYRSLPCLDGSVPSLQATKRLLRELMGFPGGLYIHCAMGHGRSAMLAATLLVLRGKAPDIDAAVQHIKQAGRAIKLSADQTAFASQVLRGIEDAFPGSLVG